MRQRRLVTAALTLALGVSLAPAAPGGEGPPTAARLSAQSIDAAIAAKWADEELTPSGTCSDGDFLRRVTLDLTGTLPSLERTRAFLADTTTDKRMRVVDELLGNDAFVEHWANVLELAWMGRRTRNERLRRQHFQKWLRAEIQANTPYDALVREMLLATGDEREDGATGYLLKWGEKASDAAGAASRHFLGVQIQCAQCHDHPYESWKQEDFGAMAGFFALTRPQRIQVEGKSKDGKPAKKQTVAWALVDNGGRYGAMAGKGGMMGGGMGGGMDAPEKDPSEMGKKERQRYERRKKAIAKRKAQTEKKMAALKDKNPERFEQLQYARTAPRVLGDATPTAISDDGRRATFAGWLTDESNPWFAPMMVNRLWGQFFGRAFVNPVEDFSPRNPASHPQLLTALSTEFRVGGYDLRAFMRLIISTRTYQLSSLPSPDNGADGEFFSRGYTRQLSAEQAFASLFQANLAGDPADMPKQRQTAILKLRRDFLAQFIIGMDTDDEESSDSFQGSIPQALMMLNSSFSNLGATTDLAGNPGADRGKAGRARAARFKAGKSKRRRGVQTTVAKVLAERGSTADRVSSLYLAALVRRPTAEEMARCTEYIAAADTPIEAYQDVLWALLNSTEFMVQR